MWPKHEAENSFNLMLPSSRIRRRVVSETSYFKEKTLPLGSDILVPTFVQLLEAFLESVLWYICLWSRRLYSDFLSGRESLSFKIPFSRGKRKILAVTILGNMAEARRPIVLGKVLFDHKRPMCRCVIMQKKRAVSCPSRKRLCHS
jgi:hypothetical protein